MAVTTRLGKKEVTELYQKPLLDLVFQAAEVHRLNHDPRLVQCSTLLSIKTGACSEDCGYCSQSAHHSTDLEPESLMSVEAVVTAAQKAKRDGADRFCMGAAWKSPRGGRGFEDVLQMVREVRKLGLETCATLGMLTPSQARALKEAGLDFYNHNLDTSPRYYDNVVSTHSYEDRLNTLSLVREAGMKVCCGGILGLGESEQDRVDLLLQLANQEQPPESVPINALVPVAGTPLEDMDTLPWDQMVRAVAVARILMPAAQIRLSAGRSKLSEEAQSMCFLAGANSIFLGDQLLTTPNQSQLSDAALFQKLGLNAIADASQGQLASQLTV
jgi:biotin synthase